MSWRRTKVKASWQLKRSHAISSLRSTWRIRLPRVRLTVWMKRWINLLQAIDVPILTTFWSVVVNRGSIWDLKCVYQTSFSNNISLVRLIGKLVQSNYSSLLSRVSISLSTSILHSSRKMATTTTYPRKLKSWTHKTSLTPPVSTPGSSSVSATSITSSGST